jgi:superfamily II DNA or RNA helicase
MIKLKRVSLHTVNFVGCDTNGKKTVAQILTYINPNPYDLYRKKEMFNKIDFTFPFGLVGDVINFCKENDINYEFHDIIFPGINEKNIDKRLTGKYEHQKEAVINFFKKRIGIIKVPTRGGKTFITSEIIRQWQLTEQGTSFLFIVDTEDLFRQAFNDFKSFFEKYNGIDIGEIRAGKFEPKHITIGMIQTIQRMFTDSKAVRRKQIKDFLNKVDFLCVDEIHDNVSSDRLKIYKKCNNLNYQLCLSATPYRDNAWYSNLKLKAWSGDIIYEVMQDVLIERGVLTKYEVGQLIVDHTKLKYRLANDDYRGIEKELIHESVFRNNKLLNLTELLKELQLKTLFLFQSIRHGQWFSKQTDIPFIHGSTDVDNREKQKEIFLNNEDSFLAASGIFKKGITLPQSLIMVNVDGGLESANVLQKSGRVLGAIKGKDKSAVIDFVDIYDRYFSEHSEKRLHTYIKSVGEEHVKLFDMQNDEWLNEVRKWLKGWFTEKKCGDMQ